MEAHDAPESNRARTRAALGLGGLAGTLAAANEAKTVYTAAAEQWGRWRARDEFSVELPEDDVLFLDALEWVDSLLVGDERRALSVKSTNRTQRSDGVGYEHDAPSSPQRRLSVSSVTKRASTLHLDGHAISVGIVAPGERKGNGGTGRGGDGGGSPRAGGYADLFEPDLLCFTCESRDGQLAVIRGLEELLALRERSDRQPVVRILDTRWSGWRHRGDLPPRPLASVVLRAGQLERVVADLETFLASEDEYNRRALPWHRGYLLEGPPGTGKTSVARALASHFGMDLWYAPLGDVKDDSSLLSLMVEVHPRSMVLLEDVDVFAASREREATVEKHVTLSGLLNALDGVATPHGLVTVMTTNQPKGLDDALVRPGRMDVVETLDLPDRDQAARLFEFFYGRRPTFKYEPLGVSTATLLEVFKQHMHDPDKAERTLQLRARV